MYTLSRKELLTIYSFHSETGKYINQKDNLRLWNRLTKHSKAELLAVPAKRRPTAMHAPATTEQLLWLNEDNRKGRQEGIIFGLVETKWLN